MRFPPVKASNLSGREYTLPAGLEGDLNIVALAFQMWHQNQVDTWMPLLEQVERRVPVVRAGMRGGIPDPATRARTITLYLDKERFRQALGLPDEDHIYVLLMDRDGQVHWQTRGPYCPQKAESLMTVIEQKLAIA